MTIRLHLKRMKVVRVLEDEIDKLVIGVANTRTVVRCPACGHKTTKVHETRKVEVCDIPLGRPTTLILLQRRVECGNCGERHAEDHPEIEGSWAVAVADHRRSRRCRVVLVVNRHVIP